ncbi:MAG: hypothetical protein ACYC5O_24105 [Anaerolineae bacterium]
MDEDRSGALGCGCALPLGLVLGLVAFALIGTLSGSPAAAATTGPGAMTLALSEAYLGSALGSLSTTADGPAWQLDVLPDGQLALQGMVTASALGREMSLPVRLLLSATAVDGEVQFALTSAELPGGVDAATATGMVSPLLSAASSELQARLASTLGPTWSVSAVSTNDSEMLLILTEEAAQ